jgi:hypothetical protein
LRLKGTLKLRSAKLPARTSVAWRAVENLGATRGVRRRSSMLLPYLPMIVFETFASIMIEMLQALPPATTLEPKDAEPPSS